LNYTTFSPVLAVTMSPYVLRNQRSHRPANLLVHDRRQSAVEIKVTLLQPALDLMVVSEDTVPYLS
jgi:hypothetical protein